MRKNILLIGLVLTFMVSCMAQSGEVLSPKDFKAKMAEPATVLDVRSADEFKSGHLEKALNIDINNSQFEDLSSKLDKSKPVLVYCLAGARSKKAGQILRKKGFTVLELKGGIDAWQEEGLPVVK
jgi:rhodanese-related sulfurtransferase